MLNLKRELKLKKGFEFKTQNMNKFKIYLLTVILLDKVKPA